MEIKLEFCPCIAWYYDKFAYFHALPLEKSKQVLSQLLAVYMSVTLKDVFLFDFHWWTDFYDTLIHSHSIHAWASFKLLHSYAFGKRMASTQTWFREVFVVLWSLLKVNVCTDFDETCFLCSIRPLKGFRLIWFFKSPKDPAPGLYQFPFYSYGHFFMVTWCVKYTEQLFIIFILTILKNVLRHYSCLGFCLCFVITYWL